MVMRIFVKTYHQRYMDYLCLFFFKYISSVSENSTRNAANCIIDKDRNNEEWGIETLLPLSTTLFHRGVSHPLP